MRIPRPSTSFLSALLLAVGLLSAPAIAQAQCSNTCATANDGECDDGGPGSLYSVCTLGTDCNDCGPRGGQAPPPQQQAGTLCTNTCSTANDSECDDGGPGSLYSICALGSDCNDCGPRVAGSQPPPQQGGMLCTNTCSTSNDSECDDGGPGSLYSICALGSDCNDCGPRSPGAQAPAQQPVGGSGEILCTNTCSSARDNECDDGGPNSLYSICPFGSDCNDCGPRRAP